MEEPLKDFEIKRLRQLICDHMNTTNTNEYGCTCCSDYDQTCSDCGLEIDHECYDHSDGYCQRCS